MPRDDPDDTDGRAGSHIAMIGMAGTGKTTVGRALAARRRLRFVDLDRAIERSEGARIGDIFDREGESGFRVHETDVLAAVVAEERPHVISTGGGVVVTPANRRLLADRTRRVWLRARVDTLTTRLTASRVRRPLLEGDLHQNIERLRSERDRWYAELADVACEVDDRTVEEIVAELDGRLA